MTLNTSTPSTPYLKIHTEICHTEWEVTTPSQQQEIDLAEVTTRLQWKTPQQPLQVLHEIIWFDSYGYITGALRNVPVISRLWYIECIIL